MGYNYRNSCEWLNIDMPDHEHEEWLANQKARKEAEAATRRGLSPSAKRPDDEDDVVEKTPPATNVDTDEDDDEETDDDAENE
jgi:hypothetical protein